MARGSTRRLIALATVAGVMGALVGLPAPAFADSVRDTQWHLQYLKITEAHKISQGEGVVVALIDSGVDSAHEDLTGNILPGIDVVAGGNGNGLGDTDGHGTAMAGLIAAHGHGTGGADGMLGIAPKAKILSIRITAGKNTSTSTAFVQAVDYAIAAKARIVSVSGAAQRADETMQAVQRAQAAGLLIVAAAGNLPEDGSFVIAPASYRGVIAVSATDRNGAIAAVSQRGPEVSIAAPGIDINSTSNVNGGGKRYTKGFGTSESTAIVSGTAALIWSRYPTLTAREVATLLTTTAVDKGAQGRDPDYGFGIVDPLAALSKNQQSSPTAGTSGPAPATPDDTAAPGGSSASYWPLVAVAGVLVAVGASVVILLTLRRRRSAVSTVTFISRIETRHSRADTGEVGHGDPRGR
jgi:type VII secretion-associated serine protease mycosin